MNHPELLRRARRVGVAILALVAGVVGAAVPGELPADVMFGTRVAPPGADAERPLELWLGRTVSADLGTLQPGLYRVHLDGRFHGRPSVRFTFSARVADAAADEKAPALGGMTFYSNLLPFDGAYHARSFDVTVTRPIKHAVLNLGVVDTTGEPERLRVEAIDNKALARSGGAALEEIGSAQVETGGGLNLTLEEAASPASGQSYLVRGIGLERLPATLRVARVWPDKINYFPGDAVQVDVAVDAFAGSAKGQLKVQLERNLDETIVLLDEPVQAQAGTPWRKTVTWTADAEYGYTLRATVTDAAGGVHSALSYFSVSENVFEVSLQGWGRVGVMNNQGTMRQLQTMPDEELKALSDASALTNRANFFNHIEFFSWAPDDFFNLAPEGDTWWSGTMAYIKVKRDILAEIRAQQAQGIKVLAYAQPFAIGNDTVLEMRRNPDFFSFSGNGAPSVSYDYDLIKSRARMDIGTKKGELPGGLNFTSLATVDRGVDEIIESWKMFGWDGVRFDNRYYRARNVRTSTGKWAVEGGTNLDELSARNVAHMKERFLKEIGPKWRTSHNNGYRFYLEPDNRLGWMETVKDGLMCMDEETYGAHSSGHHLHKWHRYMTYAQTAVRTCTELGGYYQLFPPDRGTAGKAEMLYYVISCLASGSHPISSDPEGSPAGRYGRFMTRNSAMLWSRELLPLKTPERYLDFPGVDEKALWWKEFSNTRQVGEKHWLIYSLVVPPVTEGVGDNPHGWIPKTTAGHSALLPKGAYTTAPRVFFATGETDPEPRLLPLTETADGWQVQLPRMAHYGLLTIETTGAPQ